jgi:Mrp family chromosome partitioning ATPase
VTAVAAAADVVVVRTPAVADDVAPTVAAVVADIAGVDSSTAAIQSC